MNPSYSRSRYGAVATISQRLQHNEPGGGGDVCEEAMQWVKSKAGDESLFLG